MTDTSITPGQPVDASRGHHVDTQVTGVRGHGAGGLYTPAGPCPPRSDELIEALDHDSDEELEADIARLIAIRRARKKGSF